MYECRSAPIQTSYSNSLDTRHRRSHGCLCAVFLHPRTKNRDSINHVKKNKNPHHNILHAMPSNDRMYITARLMPHQHLYHKFSTSINLAQIRACSQTNKGKSGWVVLDDNSNILPLLRLFKMEPEHQPIQILQKCILSTPHHPAHTLRYIDCGRFLAYPWQGIRRSKRRIT